MDDDAAIDDLAGFRRRFVITPAADYVRAEVEDDYHYMSVAIMHDGGVATLLQARVHRAPWSTCPGAEAKLLQTFSGMSLADFNRNRDKQRNCTHLHDLATLAAAHAFDDRPLVYDVLVSDPIGGKSWAELRRNGVAVHRWTLAGFTLLSPPEAAGQTLFKMAPYLGSLDAPAEEAARVLRWGAMIAHGRAIPLEKQSDATRMPPNCYTFQPEMAEIATRIGVIRDFSTTSAALLDGAARRTAQ